MKPRWSVTNVYTQKKSKFRAFCTPIKSNLSIPELLKDIPILDKTTLKASHPTMYAWKTATSEEWGKANSDTRRGKAKGRKNGEAKEESEILNKLVNLNQGFHDNNEGGSGLRLLGLLDRLRLVNILVVVSRWYGGVPLGPGRFKCISDVAMEALQNGGYLKTKPGKGWIDCLKSNNGADI